MTNQPTPSKQDDKFDRILDFCEKNLCDHLSTYSMARLIYTYRDQLKDILKD